MIGRFRKSNSHRDASPDESPFSRSDSASDSANSFASDSTTEKTGVAETITEFPPVMEDEVVGPLLPVSPEMDSQFSTENSAEENGALGTRIMRGVSWTLAGTLATQVMGVLRTIVLARLLSQGDFGVAAMALTVIGALYTLTNTSVVGSVISSKFDTDEELHRYVNLVWTMEIMRGAVISVLLLALSLPFAMFYKEPRLFPMLLALSISPICTSLQNIGLYLHSRQVEMKSLTLHGFYTNTLTVFATIFLAVVTRNYWALVIGQIFGAFAGMALSFIFSSYRPRLFWDRDMATRAFNFGKHQFVIGLSNYALTMMDNVAVGYWLGKDVLGVYVVAYSFCTLARMLVYNAFNSVLFPAFAMAGREDDPEPLRNLVERAFTLGTLALTVLLTPLIAFAPAVLRVFYGTKWSSAVMPMRLLLLAGFFAGLLSLFSAFFVGLDRPQLESKGKIWDAILFLLILCPLTLKFGASGAALTGVIAWAGASTWRCKWANELTSGALKRLPYLIVSSLAITALGCAIGVLPWAHSEGGWLQAFELSTPSLGVAWLQILLGSPLVGAFCVGAFAILHPVARKELVSMQGKLSGKWKRA